MGQDRWAAGGWPTISRDLAMGQDRWAAGGWPNVPRGTDAPTPPPVVQQMGGVGLVFYRDGQSPYLVVKDVVHDGPAFRSSLIYHGDKLCCINDFDLAWSEKTPRSQQPQLPGSHGSAVTLTFDRSVDTSYPERFTITLIRNMGFYPGLCMDALQNRPSAMHLLPCRLSPRCVCRSDTGYGFLHRPPLQHPIQAYSPSQQQL